MITWLVSYPRSGNTYLRILMNKVFNVQSYSIHGDKSDIAENPAVAEVVGHLPLDDFNLDSMRDSTELFYVKSHELPDSDSFDFVRDKFIYVVRDGREATLSYQHYLKTIANEKITLSDVIVGNVSFGSWGEHVQKWSLYSQKSSFLLLKFESLMDDFDDSIKNINHFINSEGDNASDVNSVPSFSELNSQYPDFFRSGQKSSWQEKYTNSQQVAFNQLFRKELLSMGYAAPLFESEDVLKYSTTLQVKNINTEVMEIKKMTQQQLSNLQGSIHNLERSNYDLQQQNRAFQESIRFKIGSMILFPLDVFKKLQSRFK
ncbi:sulfotransferase domain-containing protein [Vibrio cyclitrophicus]|uniref:sulfotransferase domain-containing protein n=2 Tax=Vibrionaceae TaxID=641 RepID=UPI000300A281|nr:sulfotransferase domain-containing protein [Vibrio cyclitrophicus]OCH48068.1 hypothetical protein A6D96_15085 [Vibrio cyclitrophicus]